MKGSDSVPTNSRATTTSDNVISALKNAYERKREAEVRKAVVVYRLQKRRVERETEQNAKK